jgi:hypothetical protein
MIRYITRYLAVRSYVRKLSHDLVRRFGNKSFYSIEQVTQAVQRGKFSAAFISYAHAAFCSELDFNAHYQSLGACCTYPELRRTIGQRYLYGQLDFDANGIISRFRPNRNQGEFYESRMGEDYPNH